MNQPYNYFLSNSGKLYSFDAHKVPEFKEVKQIDWVVWGTDKEWKNRYGDYLIWLYNSSAKHNAIVNGKNTYIVGNGWGVNEQGLGFEDKVHASAFRSELEDSNITKYLSLDRVLFGGFSAEVIPNKKGNKVTFHHIDFSKIRVGKTEYNEDGSVKPTVYYYTSDWSSKRPKENKDFEEFYEFTWDLKEMDSNKKYIVYYKDYRPDLQEYPLPEYIGAVPYINADYEISNFTFNNVKQGFSAGYLVNFYNGEPSEKQKAQIEDRFKATKHGSDNAGDPILSFNEDKDSGVEITPLPVNGQDDRFINLNEQIRDEIYTGHNFNPTLIGLKTANGFNNNADELRVAEEMLQNTYVTKHQKTLEDFVNSWADLNGVKGQFFIERLKPISEQIGEAEISAVLTVNERRARLGYEPLETGGTLEGQSFSFKSDEDWKDFEACGTEDDGFEFIDSRVLFATDCDDAEDQGRKFQFASKNANTLLLLLVGDPNLSISELSDLTGLPENEIQDLLDELKTENLLDEDGQPTEEAKEIEPEIFTVYKYVKAPNVSGPADLGKGRTRPFCRNLLRLSRTRSWTIEDIRSISARRGYDVFSHRGGWWNDNGINKPFCRHVWEQRLVRKK